MEQSINDPRFRNCPACGNLTPADNAECVHCGYSSVESVVVDRDARLERTFLQAFFTRSNPVTYLLVGVNVGIFVLMWMAGGQGSVAADDSVLVGFGAKVNPLIDSRGQYWRLITCIFIHIGFLHLFFNNYALWIIGREIERLYGSSRFTLLYLLTGLAGSFSSYYYYPETASAGASGAIFGLFGVMATFAFRYRREIPEVLRRDIKRRVIPIILVNLALGFMVPIFDMAAHIGGLVSGIALALVIPYKRPQEKATAIVWRALLVVCLAVISFSFVEAFQNYDGPRPSFANLSKFGGSQTGNVFKSPRVKNYYEDMASANNDLTASMGAFISVLERRDAQADLTPARQPVERGLQTLRGTPEIEPEADQFRKRLQDLLSEVSRILDEHARAPRKDWAKARKSAEANMARFGEFRRDFGEWAPGFLGRYGFRLEQQQP